MPLSLSWVPDQDAVKKLSKPKIVTENVDIVHPGDDRVIEQVIGGNLTILEGRDLVLTCPTEGEPNPSISWLLNGKEVTKGAWFSVGFFV